MCKTDLRAYSLIRGFFSLVVGQYHLKLNDCSKVKNNITNPKHRRVVNAKTMSIACSEHAPIRNMAISDGKNFMVGMCWHVSPLNKRTYERDVSSIPCCFWRRGKDGLTPSQITVWTFCGTRDASA